MKTKFIKLFTVVLTMSMAFVGCSNDDDKVHGAKDIQKEYAAEDVAVKFGDAVIAGASVSMKAIDDKNIVVTLKNVVSGFANFDVDAAVVTTTKAVEYAFAGEKTVGDMKISITGVVVDGKVTINVTNKITSSIVGEWGFYTNNDGLPKTITLVYTNKDDKSTYRTSLGEELEGTNAAFCDNTNGLINMFASIALTDVKITLSADGYISASAILMGEDKPVVANNAARYTYDSAKKLIYINLPLPNEIAAILGFSDLPLTCEVKEDQLCATVQYETLKPLITLLKAVDANGAITEMVKNLLLENMGDLAGVFGSLATNLVEDIFTALKDNTTTNVELGLTMAKYVTPEVE